LSYASTRCALYLMAA